MASLSQGRTAAAQCGLFTYKSVPVIFKPPCNNNNNNVINLIYNKSNIGARQNANLRSDLCITVKSLILPSPAYVRCRKLVMCLLFGIHGHTTVTPVQELMTYQYYKVAFSSRWKAVRITFTQQAGLSSNVHELMTMYPLGISTGTLTVLIEMLRVFRQYLHASAEIVP